MPTRSLRVRLLAIFLGGIVLITIFEVLVGRWGLERVRNLASDDSSQALEQQASDYFQAVAQDRAGTLSQNLQVTQQMASATRDYLNQMRTFRPAEPPVFHRASDGRRYSRGVTTTLLPPGDDDQQMADMLADSESIEVLLPSMARQLPEIARISYLTAFGALRTYPSLSPSDLPEGWTIQSEPAYQAAATSPLRTMLWSDIHPGLGMTGQVISAVAPIYEGGEFIGGVTIDVNLNHFTSYVRQIRVEQTGFAFMLDEHGHLVAAPDEGQRTLLERTMLTREQGTIALEQALPSLKSDIDLMRRGGSAVTTWDIRGRQYLVAYAPIEALGWTLAIAAPVEEITESADAMTSRIAGIASDTSRLGLLTSVVAVVLLGGLLSMVLRRQIIRPITGLVSATQSIAAGDLCPIAVKSDDELGQLARAFNTMTESVAASRAELTAANQQLEQKIEERTADLHMAVTKLEETSATQEELLRALREVSTPVIPVVAGALAMPLIGQIDEQRARNMTAALLDRIERERARTVLLDITGVPVIDTHVAQSLLQMVAASRLLGAEVVLVGVAPEVAQTIVTLGIDLRGLRTAADLRSAVEDLLSRRRRSAQPAIQPV